MCNLLLQFQADFYRWPTLLRLLVWERRRRWEFSSMSLELNRKSSICKYLPKFDLWSKYLTTSAVHFWQNQIFTNLPKEPELRDLSHKHNCKKLPCFEDFWFSQKFWIDKFQDEMRTPQKLAWPLKILLNLTQTISFLWEVYNVSHFFDLTRWRKIGN